MAKSRKHIRHVRFEVLGKITGDNSLKYQGKLSVSTASL